MAEPAPNPVILIPARRLRSRKGVHRSGYGRARIAEALAIVRPMSYNCHLRREGPARPGIHGVERVRSSFVHPPVSRMIRGFELSGSDVPWRGNPTASFSSRSNGSCSGEVSPVCPSGNCSSVTRPSATSGPSRRWWLGTDRWSSAFAAACCSTIRPPRMPSRPHSWF